MSPAPLVMRIMASSIAIGNQAGKIIRDIMSAGELGIVDKGSDDLQTEADRSAQRCILASLSNQFPNVRIIGEEGTSDLVNVPSDWIVTDLDQEFLKNKCPDSLTNINEQDLVIWVDPLDGTSEYTQGILESVTVLIGLSVQNKAVGGIIHQPYYKRSSDEFGRTIWGLKGLGSSGYETKPHVQGELIATTTRSHSNELVQSALRAIEPTKVIRVGGAGYKVLQLLEGDAHAYVFASGGCKKWDTCAPEAVLEADGGMLTDILGNHYQYGNDVAFPNKMGVIATAKNVEHMSIINKIPDDVKEKLSK
ncbi:3'(2'),5'-bisphosphate nucleotidase 1 [Sitodiplosis mosellana]|uniref:3'(2'),5'-bisphosphate nucleotidase 1 n=1 Tax=Sitodiplosis mosellana TaxID=263140 RepID=UPI00244421FB|nr:3'(2'),5'-bisphosphate nucleotidase 1 [Sitodiplosis mosellana]